MTAIRKRCFKCEEERPIEEFYRHPRMGDGYLNKCKQCTKRDVSSNYRARKPRYQAYERERFQTERRKRYVLAQAKKHRRLNPQKSRARVATARAIRSGRLVRLPCEVCGHPVTQAHHEDYSKPLDVRWLCFKHHREVHGQEVSE